MRKLRSALGDDAETPRYIETLPRKGYAVHRQAGRRDGEHHPVAAPCWPPDYKPTSFETGAVIGRRASRPARAASSDWRWGSAASRRPSCWAFVAWRMPGKLFQPEAARAEDLPTIVVLPLVDMSVAQSEQRAVRRPHRRAVELAGAHPDAARGRAHLGVRVQGQGHRRAPDRRASSAPRTCSKAACAARRTSCASPCSSSPRPRGCTSGRDSYDLPLGDIFQIEDTVSRSVAEKLHLELTPAVERAMGRAARRDRRCRSSCTCWRASASCSAPPMTTSRPLEYFRRAVAADPKFAPALARAWPNRCSTASR